MLPALVDVLRRDEIKSKADALWKLAQILDTSFGTDAEVLCEYLRVSGCVKLLCTAIDHEDPTIRQAAMLLVGNLASEAVDPQADKSRAILKEHEAFRRLLRRLFDTDPNDLVHALGAMQVSGGMRSSTRAL